MGRIGIPRLSLTSLHLADPSRADYRIGDFERPADIPASRLSSRHDLLGAIETDLLGGDWATLLASIGTLAERFPPGTAVHPGHGPSTTLGAELARNPFLAELRDAEGKAAG